MERVSIYQYAEAVYTFLVSVVFSKPPWLTHQHQGGWRGNSNGAGGTQISPL